MRATKVKDAGARPLFRTDWAHKFRGTATLEMPFDVHLRSRPLEIQQAPSSQGAC